MQIYNIYNKFEFTTDITDFKYLLFMQSEMLQLQKFMSSTALISWD